MYRKNKKWRVQSALNIQYNNIENKLRTFLKNGEDIVDVKIIQVKDDKVNLVAFIAKMA